MTIVLFTPGVSQHLGMVAACGQLEFFCLFG